MVVTWKKFPFGLALLGLHQVLIVLTAAVESEPSFLGSMKNVTVVQGRNASLTCKVHNLGDYKIAWINEDDRTRTLLTIQGIVLPQTAHYQQWAERLSVTKSDRVSWTLHIRNVTRMHQGFYQCLINTEPMIMQMAYLEVLILPDIVSNESTGISETNPGDQSIEESAVPAGDTLRLPPSTDIPFQVSSSPENNYKREAPGLNFCLSSWLIRAFVPWCVALSSLLALPFLEWSLPTACINKQHYMHQWLSYV